MPVGLLEVLSSNHIITYIETFRSKHDTRKNYMVLIKWLDGIAFLSSYSNH